MNLSQQPPDALQEAIAASPLVRAAIVEAVHLFYYDRILSTKKDDQQAIVDVRVDDILSKLWNLYPDWRNVLLQYPQRYRGAATTSVSIFGKPKDHRKFISPQIEFE